MDLATRKPHNTFFYASVCHICKQSHSDSALKQCAGCKMIAYCSREHQKKDWPEHKDLCKAIQHVRATFTEELSAYQGTPKMLQILKEKVKHKLQRNLKLYEVHMFKYPKMCLVCYKINGGLKCCPHCMTVWYCEEHKNNHDSKTCDLLKHCFETSISFFHEPPLSYITDAFMRVISYKKKFSDMKEFIDIYGDIKGIHSKTSPNLLKIKQSVRLTRPMTILYGMRVLNYISTYEKNKTELVLHVIAASKSELYTLREWEILLHIFPNLLRLKLVLIGPLDKFMRKQTVCNTCVRKKKIFLVEWQNIPYPQYVHKCPTFKEPDLVIRFYNSLYEDKILEGMWKSSLKYMAQRNCPLLLCHPHQHSTLNNIINTELSNTIKFRIYDNPFASLKPNRIRFDGDSGYYAFYENKYLTVYKTLCQQLSNK